MTNWRGEKREGRLNGRGREVNIVGKGMGKETEGDEEVKR